MLIFVCSSSSVDYFNDILPQLLKNDKRKLLAVHGRRHAKRDQIVSTLIHFVFIATRCLQVETFRKTKNTILVCTDMMARGLDVTDIDWVSLEMSS